MSIDAISKALKDFGEMPLREGAIRFLGELGLSSERTISADVAEGSVDNFLRQFPQVDQKLTDKQRDLFYRLIRSIFVLFQITEKESGLSPVPLEGESIIAHSILVVVADMKHCPYLTQGELNNIIRVLNRGFGPAVIGLFRHDNHLALAAAPKREHRLDATLDALITSGVTLGISLCNPSSKHRKFLLQWKSTIGTGQTLGDVVNHLAYVPNDLAMKNLCEKSDAPDHLRFYLEAICRWPLLSDVQEKHYAQNLHINSVRRKFIYSNLRLVVWYAYKYASVPGIDFLDLIQAGNIGLMKAADEFDCHRGTKFSTYAIWWVRQRVVRVIDNESRTIRIPVHMLEKVRNFERAKQRIEQKKGREALLEEISQSLGWSEETARTVQQFVLESISFGTIDLNLADSTEDKNIKPLADQAADNSLIDAMQYALHLLTDREANVVRMRFGIGMETEHTLEEIGKQFSVTRERVRQIEAKALRKLRHPSRAERLRIFLGKS